MSIKTNVPIKMCGEQPSFYIQSIGWSSPEALTISEAPPEAVRYILMVQVGDYPRLARAPGPGDVFEQVDDDSLEAVRQGRALIVFDLSNEGPAFFKEVFDGFHQNLKARNVSPQSCLFLSQNRALPNDYALTYGPGSISFGFHDFFVKLLISQFDAELSQRFVTSEEVAGYRPGVESDARGFLCLNATPRWHRILIYRYLTMRRYATDGLLSFHGANEYNPKASSLDFSTMPESISSSFSNLVEDIGSWFPKQPIRFDADPRTGNDLTQSLEAWAYRSSLYSIVTESDFFDEARIERITEKVIKAACFGHPFIVVGNPRSVSFLSELGFETFGSVIDHQYDREYNPSNRMKMIFNEIDKQQNWISKDKKEWIDDTRESSMYNFQYARNGLKQRYERVVELPLLKRLERFVKTGRLEP